MNRIKKISLTILLLLSVFSLSAQQDAMFTHYMYNTLAVNPAYAGSRDALTLTGIHRTQWTGFPNAPKTQTFTMHTPMLRPELGFGLSMWNDIANPVVQRHLALDFMYKIKFEEGRNLAFGIKASLGNITADFASLRAIQPGDAAAETTLQGDILPNFGTGIYYYTPRFYVGFSVPKIVQNDYTNIVANGFDGAFGEQRHYYFISGGVFDLSETVKFKPVSYLKVTYGAPIELDLTSNFIFYNRFSLGAMLRLQDSYGALVSFFINEQLEFGYSYDRSYALGRVSRSNIGSHELMLRYDFIYNNKRSVRSPRNFYF